MDILDLKGATRSRVGDEKSIEFQISKAVFEVILNGASVREPVNLNWFVQHNTIWTFLVFRDGLSSKLVRRNLHKLIFREIKAMDSVGNFKGARVLGFRLNVLGLKVRPLKRGDYGSEEYAIHKFVVGWTKKNFLRLEAQSPALADACLQGSITFDRAHSRLVKTFAGGLSREPDRDYLELDLPG